MAEQGSGRLAGKVALITGGARGQGAEEGRLFAAEGATVILTDVLDDEGKATAADIGGATYRHLDVSSEEEWETVVAETVAGHGALDVLVKAGFVRIEEEKTGGRPTQRVTLIAKQARKAN